MKQALGERDKIKEFTKINHPEASDNSGAYYGDFKKGTKIRHGKGASIMNLSDQTIVAGLTWAQRKAKAKTFTGKYQSWNVSTTYEL